MEGLWGYGRGGGSEYRSVYEAKQVERGGVGG